MVAAQEIDDAFILLKNRNDKQALVILEQVLDGEPGNLDALWGKAEVLRRKRDYKEAQALLNNVLKKNPSHSSALLSLSYIRLKEDNLKDALKLVNRALVSSRSNKENQALAYVMLGTINAARAARGSFFSKITYGLRIKGYFLKARKLAPNLPETHLAIGTFYLSAPKIIGGNLDLAIQELEQAVRIAPEFATANARLAAAFKIKGNLERYNYYSNRAEKLDPENEVLKEIKGASESRNEQIYRESRIMMGTTVEIVSQYKEALTIAFVEMQRIEGLLSKYKKNSEVSRLNKLAKLAVSPETFYIVKKAKEFSALSSGAFDVTVGALVDLWGFTDQNFTVPTDDRIKDILNLIGSDKILLHNNENVIEFEFPGMKIDLGAIAKGYAVDCAIKKLKEKGIDSCLINAGGQVYCLGKKFGAPWKVAIRGARGKGLEGFLELTDRSVATSGDYEQYFIKDNKRYAHIFNPKTGYPANSGVIAVTVIAQDGLTSDALATAIFVLGKDKGEKLANKFKGVEVKIYAQDNL